MNERALRILQVLEPSGGGSGRHFLDLCRGLAGRGHHVEAIYSPLRAEKAFVSELATLGLAAVHSIAMTRAPGPGDLAAARAIGALAMAGQSFDILHGHSSKAGALARLCLRLPSRKARPARIYTPHAFRTMDPTLGRGGRLIYGTIERVLARWCTDGLICVSQDELDHARALGMPDRVLSLVVNGVTPGDAQAEEQVRRSLGIGADALIFGFVGRLAAQKAPERLVGAFAKAIPTLGDTHLVMIGAGELGGAMHEAIKAHGLTGRVHLTSAFKGPVAIREFDILVMPSRYEAMSYVMLEAAAAGKPIIATDVGGATTVIEAGMNGMIVPNTDDVTALSRAMTTLADPETLQRFKASAEGRMHRFSADAMIDQTEAVYRRCL